MSPDMELAYYIAGPIFLAAAAVIILITPPKQGRHRGDSHGRHWRHRPAHQPTHRAQAPTK
jgi:hypothetical protein